MSNRLEELAQGGRLLLDGGLGQELVRRGVDTSGGLWSAQALLTTPEIVVAAHRDFIAAGADVITTNTYATTRRRLEDDETFRRLNRTAAELACRARDKSGREVLIAGSLPPIHGSYRPDRVRPLRELEPQYREQAELLAQHVDLFLCETLSTVTEALAAARGAAATGKPVWVSWTLADDVAAVLRSGESLETAIAALDEVPVSALLVNCSIPESITTAMPVLAARAGRPFGGYANGFEPIRAGFDVADGRNLPRARRELDPERYADYARRWRDAGAQLLGGCCEVGPAHIARIRETVLA
ncbi:MAG: homocysteine S-methyltransferase family protein [Candidatus Competibacterales bacterium]|nr:homocysteine S-methyltransferase family protein [Candidatus Competibacterales bacterium]